MVEVPSNRRQLGEEFEFESHISKSELVQFLKELEEQLQKENKITVSMVGAEATFPFQEPVELEVDCDYEDSGKRSLEIEIEFRES